MKLHEFIAQTTQDLQDFELFYQEGMRENKSLFPEDLGEPDWFEQFLLFIPEEEREN